MAINYTIQAEIVDIDLDRPCAEDVFLVDTNVWYWMTYPRATSHIPNLINKYQSYLGNTLSVGSKIYYSGLTQAELSHIIEKTEREIYERSLGSSIRAKEFRHNYPAQHSNTVSEIKAAWAQVSSLACPLDITINSAMCTETLKRLITESVDGYDLFILESMKNNGVTQILTDDGDFCTVPGIRMFTRNKNVIDTARVQGKLLTRT